MGMVLARISNFDNRRLDESVARDWKVLLDRELHGRWDMDEAMGVVLDHFAQPSPPYFTVGLLADGLRRRLRLSRRAVADDVRSAKARGLVGRDWSDRQPLPPGVAERLREARLRDAEGVLEVESGSGWMEVEVGKHV